MKRYRHPVRRIRAATLIACVCIALLASRPVAHGTQRLARPQRPNIVFVLTDDLAWNLVPYMPHVLQLQRLGVTFVRYTVTDSLCCPSRSSIFTGLFPHDTHVFKNTGWDGGYHIFRARGLEGQTFALALQAR